MPIQDEIEKPSEKEIVERKVYDIAEKMRSNADLSAYASKVMPAVRENPDLALRYLSIMEGYNIADCVKMLIEAPWYAEHLFDVFASDREFLKIYAIYGNRLPGIGKEHKDERYMFFEVESRISLTDNPDEVRAHLEEIKEVEKKLEGILGDKNSVVLGEAGEGHAIVKMDKMISPEGALIMVIGKKDNLPDNTPAYFDTIYLYIYKNGMVKSKQMGRRFLDEGYMFRKNEQLDEYEFLRTIFEYSDRLNTKEINEAFDGPKDDAGAGKNRTQLYNYIAYS